MSHGVFTEIRSQLVEQMLAWLGEVAERAAVLPAFYPQSLRSLEPAQLRFDEIRQMVEVVEDHSGFERWKAEEIEQLRAGGQNVEWLAYSPRMAGPEGAESGREVVALPWDGEAGQRFPRAVILSDPGFGKTWLLRYEARRVALESIRELEGRTKSIEEIELPLFARLPDLNAMDGPMEEALVELSGAKRWPRAKEFLRERVGRRQSVILLDGLDEVSRPEGIRKRLEEFGRAHPEARLLVTSRIVGYEGSPVDGAAELELAAWGRKEVNAFARLWFSGHPGRGEEFLDKLEQNPQVGGLAGIPLMLALLCRAWMREGREFPQRRVELYDRCLDGLLRDWKTGKGKKPQDIVLENVRKRLARGAERLMRDGKQQFRETELAAALGFDVEDEKQARQAQRFIDERKREGILVAASVERRDLLFLHRTFQEYLAARSLAERANEDGWEEIAEVVDKKSWLPAWREVVILLAGELKEPGRLLDLLRDRGKDDFFRHRLALVAWCSPQIAQDKRDFRMDAITTEVATELKSSAEQKWDQGTGHLQEALVPLVEINAAVQNDVSLVDWALNWCAAEPDKFWGVWGVFSQTVVAAPSHPRVLDEMKARLNGEVEMSDDHFKTLWRIRPQTREEALFSWKMTTGQSALDLLAQMGPRAARSDVVRQVVALLTSEEDFGRHGITSDLGISIAQSGERGRCTAAGKVLVAWGAEILGGEILAELRAIRNRASSENQPQIYEAVSIVLAQLGDVTILDDLFSSLRAVDIEVRLRAARVLGEIGPVACQDHVVNELIEWLQVEEPRLRRSAVDTLAKIEALGSHARDALRTVSMSDDCGAGVAASLARTLIDAKPADRLGILRKAFLASLRDDNPKIRASSLRKFRKIAASREIQAEVLRLVHDEDETVRYYALSALRGLGDSAVGAGVVDELHQLLLRQTDVGYLSVLTALRRMGAVASRPDIFDALINGLQRNPISFAITLGELATPAILPQASALFFELMDHEDGSERYAASLGLNLLSHKGMRFFRDPTGNWRGLSLHELAD